MLYFVFRLFRAQLLYTLSNCGQGATWVHQWVSYVDTDHAAGMTDADVWCCRTSPTAVSLSLSLPPSLTMTFDTDFDLTTVAVYLHVNLA